MKIAETLRQLRSEGIEGLFAHQYDTFARSPSMMDHYRRIAEEVARRVELGTILEIGPGPGYIAVEIAKLIPHAEVIGLDVSHTMVGIATANARKAGVAERVSFRLGNAAQMPFGPESFDFVVSNGSLHHWKEPIRIFDEVYRVLKNGGETLIGDLRRDAPEELRNELAADIDSWFMRWGLKHSFSEAYTRQEILKLLAQTSFSNYEVVEDGAALAIIMKKCLH